MRSGYVCNACISRSVQRTSQHRVQFRNSAEKLTRKGLRQISTQTRKPKHTISAAAITKAQKGQKWAHASVATPRPPQPPALPSQAALTASSRQSTSTASHPNNDLSSTRPARLDLPEGPIKDEAGAITLKDRASYLFQLGKAYVRFYKLGVKNIWSNYKEYRHVRRRFAGRDIHDLVRHAPMPTISRREFQLYLRTRHDLKKLIPFGLVLAICGEFTPLVILALGTVVVPYTCRIPKQVKKDLQKALSRIENIERLRPGKTAVGTTPALGYIHGLDPFGLCVRETPLLGPLVQRLWLAPRLKQHMDNIISDARLIHHEGGAARLEPEELYQFCVSIAQVDAMKRLLDHHAQGAQSLLLLPPGPDVQPAQRSLQVFLDAVQRELARPKSTAPGYHPESIFVAAANYARSAGQEAPYIPPPTLRDTKRQDGGSVAR